MKLTPLNFKEITKDLPKEISKKWILMKMKVCPFCLKEGVITHTICKIHNYTYSNWYLGMLRFALDIPESEKDVFKYLMLKAINGDKIK